MAKKEAPSYPSGTPIEWVWSETSGPGRAIVFQGHHLRFEPDTRFLTAKGKPRRIEWIRDLTVIDQLTGATYNRGSRPVFVVAQDLIDKSREDQFRDQLIEVGGSTFVPIAAFQQAVQGIEERLAELEQRAGQADEPERPTRRRPPVKSPDDE